MYPLCLYVLQCMSSYTSKQFSSFSLKNILAQCVSGPLGLPLLAQGYLLGTTSVLSLLIHFHFPEIFLKPIKYSVFEWHLLSIFQLSGSSFSTKKFNSFSSSIDTSWPLLRKHKFKLSFQYVLRCV